MNQNPDSPVVDDEGVEFDRLMALEPGADPTPPSPGDTAPDPAAADQAPASGGQAAPGDGGVEPDGGSSAAASGATDDDWIAALPEEAQQRIRDERARVAQERKDAEDRYKALHERVAPTQRQLSEAQMRLRQLQSQQPASPAMPDVSASSHDVDSFFDSAEWKEYEATFPGDAKVQRMGFEAQQKAYKRDLSRLEGVVNDLTQRLARTEEVTSRASINEELRKLEEKHPDWMELNQSDEFWDWFNDWRERQPKGLRSAFYDQKVLGELLSDSDFVIARLDEFKGERKSAPVQPQPSDPQPPAPAVSAQPAPAPAANARLSMSVAPEVRGGSAVPQAVPLDSLSEDEQFDHLWHLNR